MSAVTPLIQAIPGLVDYWPLDAGAGTSAMTSGGRNMTLNNVTAGAVLVRGGGASARFNGTTSTAATAALAGGDVMRFPADAAFTMGAFVALGTPAGTKTVMGRSGAWSLRQNSINFIVTLAKSLNWPGGGVGAGVPTLITLVWDGKEAIYYSNGLMEFSAPGALGTADDTAAAFEVMSLSGTPGAAGDIADVWVSAGAMGVGDIRKIAETGVVGLGTPAIVRLAHAAVETKPPVALAPVVAQCRGCVAPVREGEAAVVTANGRRHVTCYGGRARGIPVVRPVTSNANTMTDAQIGARVAATLYDTLWWKSLYHFDGKNWPTPSGTTVTEIAGIAAPAAALHWLTGSKKDSWMRRLAIATAEQYLGTQITVGNDAGAFWGGSNAPSTQLGFAYILQTYLLLKDTLSPSVKSRWLDAFEMAGDWLVRVQKNYYVNGNIENAELGILGLLHRITGTTKWLNAYNAQFAIMVDPPPGTGNTSGVNSIFGWVQETAATQPDGSDGKGYFVESKNGQNPAEIGFDKIYGEVQLGHLSTLHMWNQDPELVPYLNSLMNKVAPYVNFLDTSATPPAAALSIDPYRIDATGGSRNNYVSMFTCHGVHYGVRKLGRSTSSGPLAGFNAGSWLAEMENEWRNNRATLGNYGRNLGELWTPWLMSTAIWPGMPDS